MAGDRWNRYVALGDSTTEGLEDPPGGSGEHYRGWADRLAELLAGLPVSGDRPGGPGGIEYANLAVRGKLLRQIVGDQLGPALDLRPDLVSLVGGGNDIIRGRDPDELSALLEDAVVRLRATGADVLMGTGYDTRGTPLLAAVRGRVGVLNANIWSIAARHGAYVLDFWGLRALHDPRTWAPDRIHLNSEGHRRVAAEAFAVLTGRRPTQPDGERALPPIPGLPLRERVAREARWAREFVAPWLGRRLRRVSSGDGRAPKYPEPQPVTAPSTRGEPGT